MEKLKIQEKHIFRHYRNDIIKKYLDSIESPTYQEVALRTIDFIKDNFPECREILRGKLIYEEEL